MRDKYLRTPLHWACQAGRYLILKFFIDRKADINAKDACKRTPLHYLVGSNNQ